MSYIKNLLVVCAVMMMFSCAAKELPPAQGVYEKDAVTLHFISDAQLNLFDGKSHTLSVCVYQLKDPNGFNQYSGDRSGLYKLLDCKLFDQGTASAKRLTIYPGEDTTLVLDRAEKAKYVAVAAGYYNMEKEGVTRLFKIPVVEEKSGIFVRKKKLKMGHLEIKLILGPRAIKTVEGNHNG